MGNRIVSNKNIEIISISNLIISILFSCWCKMEKQKQKKAKKKTKEERGELKEVLSC